MLIYSDKILHRSHDTVDRTFEEIWEKDVKWLSGPQILSMIVDDLRGKSLFAKIDKDTLGGVNIGLPLSMIPTPHGGTMHKAVLMIPEELRSIFHNCLGNILKNSDNIINACTKPYLGTRLEDRVIAQINEEFKRAEHLRECEGAQTLADMAERAFGLPNRFAASYRSAKESLAALRRDRYR